MRNGSGVYNAPASSWNPATNGALASYADWNALLADIVAALTQSVSADGQTLMSGNLNFNGNKITNLGAGSGTGQSLRWEQLFSQGTELDIASAATVDIGAQNTNFLHVTGTTAITSFGTNYNGPRFLRFAGAVLLTNSATLVIPGGANITTTAGDCLIVIPKATSGTSDGWVVVAYQNASGKPFGVVAAGKVLGRDTSGAGIVQELPIAVDTSGNVGIGGNPTYRLDLQTPNGTACRVRLAHNGVDDWSAQVPSGGGLEFLNGNTLVAKLDGSFNLKFNSGYGSVATAYGCRAWVNFNGSGTVAIRASGNVSSITDNGTGAYAVNFTTAMPDASYSYSATTATYPGDWVTSVNLPASTLPSTSSLQLAVLESQSGGTRFDPAIVCVSVFR